MLARALTVIFVTTFLIVFIMNLHSNLVIKIMTEKLCPRYHSAVLCRKAISGAERSSYLLGDVYSEVDKFSKIGDISQLVPSSFTVFIIAALVGSARNKENIGLFVSAILAVQSLVYLTISVCKASKAEHLFAGIILNTFVGGFPGAILFALALATLSTKATVERSLIFIAFEGTVYVGGASANFVSEFVPNQTVPFSYFFAATFSLAVLVFLLLFFAIPSTSEIISCQFSEKDVERYNESKTGFLHFLLSPLKVVGNEYLAGVALAGFLTELGRNLFSSVIMHYLMDVPLKQPYNLSKIYVWSTTVFQGIASIALGKFLTSVMFATDATMILLSLSCSAFWMALIGYIGIKVMLLVTTICFSGFVPIAMACLKSSATKEGDILESYFVFMFGIISSFENISKAVLVYNSHIFINANRNIYRPFTLILAGIIHLVAFVVVASISWTFNKPLVEMPKSTKAEKQRKRLSIAKAEKFPVFPEGQTEKDPFLLNEY